MKRTTAIGLGVLFVAVIAGCTHHTADEDATSMKVETTCGRTQCDARESSFESEVDQCFDAADEGDDDPSMCADVPGPTCDDAERNTCLATNWTFDVRAPADPTYQAACERSRDHMTSCGIAVSDRQDCAIYAKVERLELADLYDCLTATPCDQVTTTTACDAAPSTFGDQLCTKLASLSNAQPCTTELHAFLDEESGWLRDDVMTAGRGCLKEADPQDVMSCVQAWTTAVAPDSVTD